MDPGSLGSPGSPRKPGPNDWLTAVKTVITIISDEISMDQGIVRRTTASLRGKLLLGWEVR